MNANAPAGYSRLQIALHWIVALLIIVQIVGHEGIAEAYEAILEGGTPAAFDMVLAQVHVVGGFAVWLFAAWRLYLRFTRGVPAHPAGQSAMQEMAATVVHVALYGCMLLMPISGAVAWFGGVELAGDAHSAARIILLPAILLHVGGALFQHFVQRSDVMRRMMRPA